jgi:hypothetical protein
MQPIVDPLRTAVGHSCNRDTISERQIMVPPCSSHHKALPIHRSVWKDYYRLIAQAAPGVALFAAGLTIAAGKIILNLEVGVNAVLKMVAQPVVAI